MTENDGATRCFMRLIWEMELAWSCCKIMRHIKKYLVIIHANCQNFVHEHRILKNMVVCFFIYSALEFVEFLWPMLLSMWTQGCSRSHQCLIIINFLHHNFLLKFWKKSSSLSSYFVIIAHLGKLCLIFCDVYRTRDQRQLLGHI